eukprot:289558-Rhodomonas_salina.4
MQSIDLPVQWLWDMVDEYVYQFQVLPPTLWPMQWPMRITHISMGIAAGRLCSAYTHGWERARLS